MFSMKLLAKVKEDGETHKNKVRIHMRATLRNKLRKNLGREITDNLYAPSIAVRRKVIKMFKLSTATPVLKKSA